MGSGVVTNQLEDCPRLYGIKICDRSSGYIVLIRLNPFIGHYYASSSSMVANLGEKLDGANVTVGF